MTKPFTFPVTLHVEGRRCLVFGDGPMAAEKVEALRHAGADVVAKQAYELGDLEGAFLAVVSGEGPTDATAVWREAEERGVLLNALDDIPHCHFAFPSIVRRGDLRVAISTNGRAPVLSRALRLKLEEDLHPGLATLVDVLGQVRDATTPRTVPFPEWQRRWRAAVADLDVLLDLADRGRVDDLRERLLAAIAPAEEVA